ncbi:hypothetical protein PAP_03020 [Palaeococcus pacificus DY20341]|uniref:Agmatinase n=1 Tax=Palaeococcus pacificus DY20341 TaxID=1343739 RepID=A0A075LRR8_9EURY|nr:agmatinase [Palaeococcus pacificus]AIF69024.1 hypothetical protein PAP_03020 [Palaeococcus pacificus DY20341]
MDELLFFGIPQSEDPNLYVLGIPWDASSSFRRGAREGPKTIRASTTGLLYNSFSESLIDLSKLWRYKDLGDVETEGRTFMDVYEDVRKTVKENYKREALFLFLGGDHSITYHSVRAIKEASNEDFGLIYFDAHPDLYNAYDGSKYSHACVVRRLVEEGVVDPKNVIQIGIRAPTKEQIEFAEENGIKIISAGELYKSPNVKIKLKRAYLSFDMDVLDPAYCPGVGNPEPGGLSTRKLLEVVYQINTKIIGFDIVELAPQYDYNGISGFVAAKIIREVLAAAGKYHFCSGI